PDNRRRDTLAARPASRQWSPRGRAQRGRWRWWILPAATVPEPPRRRWTWPQRLQAAVLALALEDVERTGTAEGRQLAADARAWFAAEDDARPFAFRSVCVSLGLDPSAVRRAPSRCDSRSRSRGAAPRGWRHAPRADDRPARPRARRGLAIVHHRLGR